MTDLISSPSPSPRSRRARQAALLVTGLAAGVGLGFSGLATAATSTPTPAPSQKATTPGAPRDLGPGRHGHFGHRGGPGAMRRGDLVVSVSGNTLTVRTGQGTRTVTLTSSTAYYDGPAKASRAVLTPGRIVQLRVADPTATMLTATVVRVRPAMVMGYVATVDGSTLTLTDESGFTRTVRTSSATSYRKDGAAGKASDITVGVLVHARGKVDADGTTLDATVVGTGRPDRMGLPDGGMDDQDGPDSGASATPSA